MGYIQDIERELKERLVDMDEERQKVVIKYVKERILESYKNGLELGRQERRIKKHG